ncbi:MAG: DNA mismatch repair endonuclease MutL [Gammaproteobacteria bacterium]
MLDAAKRILALDDHVINQIAAGEVVERALSVVKELVENALDAGASRIEIQIENGGLDYISVADNGSGIEKRELPGALTRHCTSKLSQASELLSLHTLGFRGEALASIGAVSRLSLVSRVAHAAHAWRLDCNYGCISKAKPAPSYPVGTRVEVRNLFENTPARRKFQKQARTEHLQILQFLKQFSFCQKQTEIVFIADEKPVFRSLPETNEAIKQRRIRGLFGKEFAENSLEIVSEIDSLSVTGWLGRGAYHRPRTDLQYVTLNQRVVRDKSVLHAVRLAYDGRIPEGRYAAFALDIRIPSAEVDVNVHPTKSEVRFSDPRRIHDQVYSLVAQALSEHAPPSDDRQELSGAPHTRSDINYTLTSRREPARLGVADSARQSHYRRGSSAILDCAGFDHGIYSGLLGDDFALLTDAGNAVILNMRRFVSSLLDQRLVEDKRNRPLIMPQPIPPEIHEHLAMEIEALQREGLVIESLGPQRLVLREVPLVLPPLDYERFVIELATATDLTGPALVAFAASRALDIPRDFKAQQRWFAQLLEQAATLHMRWQDFVVEKTAAQWREFLVD